MLRVDNIRLLHDNRALTASLDSLNVGFKFLLPR